MLSKMRRAGKMDVCCETFATTNLVLLHRQEPGLKRSFSLCFIERNTGKSFKELDNINF